MPSWRKYKFLLKRCAGEYLRARYMGLVSVTSLLVPVTNNFEGPNMW